MVINEENFPILTEFVLNHEIDLIDVLIHYIVFLLKGFY